MSGYVTHTPQAFLTVDSPYELARWRPLVNWLLYIPHAIIQNGLRALVAPVFFVYWVGLIFTGRLNPGLYGVLAMEERYNQRADAFLLGFSERYAPFDFGMGGTDDGAYPPIHVQLPDVPETAERKAAFNVLLAIPHYLVLAVFGIAAFAVLIVGWFAVLFTGAWPHAMRDFLVSVANYWLRVWAYVAMTTRDYPRFGIGV